MLILPTEMIVLLMMFAPEFSQAVWLSTQGVLVGAILSPHKRAVTADLRSMGLNRSGVAGSVFITLLTDQLLTETPCPIRRAAWYAKTALTFADASALVRRTLCLSATFCTLAPPWWIERLLDTLCSAA